MKWYRVTFVQAGKRLKPVELPAHDGMDAVSCAGVKAGLVDPHRADSGEIQLADLECIDEPEHAKEAARRRQGAHASFTGLTEQLRELVERAENTGESEPCP